MVPLIYSPHYNITAYGLEYLHPFDSVKYRRIHDWLIARGIRRAHDFVEPRPCMPEELLRLHTPAYLESLHHSSVLKEILEVWVISFLAPGFVDSHVLEPMRWATGGTIRACRLAREQGLSINIGGGFHHASRDKGSGFCIYADTPVALANLHAEMPFRSVLIVDTDAHQGNGNADAVRPWPWAHVLDLFEDALFPWPKEQEDWPVPLASGLGGEEYLRILHECLPAALDRFAPELVVYNAGSDVLQTDPLTSLRLTVEEMVERDLYVVTQVRERNIPLAMVLSGGYGPHSWEAHAKSIEALATHFDTNEPRTK
jgi:histone deacetylase 11